MKKSGKASCCGLGGSWFGKCGGVGNVNLDHTWYEGIRVCETQFQAVVGEQLHAYQPKRDASFDDPHMIKRVIVGAHIPASAPDNASTPVPGATPITVPVNTPIMAGDHNSVVYYAGKTAFNALVAPSTTIIRASVNILTAAPTIFLANATIVLANGTLIKSMRSVSPGIPITASSATSTSAREYAQLLRVLAHISMMLGMACWY